MRAKVEASHNEETFVLSQHRLVRGRMKLVTQCGDVIVHFEPLTALRCLAAVWRFDVRWAIAPEVADVIAHAVESGAVVWTCVNFTGVTSVTVVTTTQATDHALAPIRTVPRTR